MQPAPTIRPLRTITAPSCRGALFQNIDKQEEKKGTQFPLLGLLVGQGKKEEGEPL